MDLSEECHRDSKTKFESVIVNEPSVLESLKFYCTNLREDMFIQP